jgi:hypothetical protein
LAIFFFARVLCRFLILSLRRLSGLSQVRKKINALCARNAEFYSAIAILLHAASALTSGSGEIVSASVSDSEAGVAVAVATAMSGGGVKLASVTRSLVQARRLHKQFKRRWGFARNRTLGAKIEVRVRVYVWVYECGVSGYVAFHHSLSSTSS